MEETFDPFLSRKMATIHKSKFGYLNRFLVDISTKSLFTGGVAGDTSVPFLTSHYLTPFETESILYISATI